MSRKLNDEQTKTPPALWWETLDEECPITLEPLKLLPYPPFVLDNHQYFDGVALANYIISRGMFENPLTREPLTYADCKRLDDYVRLYAPENTRMAVCCEAFCLKQSVRVSSNNETDHRRSQVLRGEAAAALVHLFVYGRRTSTNSNTEVPRPRHAEASFHLYDPPCTRTAIQEMDGLRIIDDDEERVVQSEQSEYRQVQQSFPPLTTFENSAPTATVNVDEHLLAVARETAAISQQEQETRMRLLTQARIRLMREARMRQEERRKARQEAQAAQREYCQKQRQEENELELARAEIETWRNQHWDKLLEESRQKQEAFSVPRQPVAILPPKQEEEEVDEATIDSKEIERIQSERKKHKVAAKRRRQKERKKEQKDQEQEAARKREEEERLEREKDASAKKCACCGDGILGHGFEKFGHFYCSTKCARTGPKSNETGYTDK